MQIQDFLSPDVIAVGMTTPDKDSLIDQMVDLLANHPAVDDAGRVREAVISREKMMSTGVGKGLALPHAKCDAVSSTAAALATLAEPIDYGSIDDEPVRIVFMLVGTPAAKSQHVKVLSRISRLMNREAIRARLLRSESPEELLDIFRDAEARLLEA